ncbi:MAG: universal stress protein [Candidatus Rokuibacteriota bacterium]
MEEMAALQVDRPTPVEGPADETSRLRRMLVPLDGSPVAETIIPFVSRIARPLGLEIVLLRAVPAVPPQVVEGGARHMVIDNTDRLRQEADDYLRATADGLSTNGFRVLTAVRVGDAATEIVAGARECQVDVIAMTTHGRTGLGRLLFGSVAEAVLRRAHVPVLTMRATEAERTAQAA